MNVTASEVAILGALDIAVFERDGAGIFRALGTPPDCFARILPQRATAMDLEYACPFLGVFLPAAESIWAASKGRVHSGTWMQRDFDGIHRTMEAWAVAIAGHSYLLLKMLGDEYEERHLAFQQARDSSLSNEKLESVNRELATAGEQLRARGRELERLNELKSEFVASMSHELRTPLNAIIGFSTLLAEERDGKLNAQQRGFIEHVMRAGRHLLSLINEILDLTRSEAGFLELNQENVDFNALLAETVAGIWPLAEAKQIVLESTIDSNLMVNADPVRLKQILYNLLSNAVKFTREGGRISVVASQKQSEIVVEVEDSGIGIAEDDQRSIFEKFHRADSRAGEGTGLGLPITKRLVERHGGRIWFSSTPGEGSRFTFTIPRNE